VYGPFMTIPYVFFKKEFNQEEGLVTMDINAVRLWQK
jgi:hypothetical protein